jgi:hypothetical protein
MTEEAVVVVQVRDVVEGALTGHEGCVYQSPPQVREQALTLVRVLLGYPSLELNGGQRWTCAIAGGRRTIWLTPTRGRAGLPESAT